MKSSLPRIAFPRHQKQPNNKTDTRRSIYKMPAVFRLKNWSNERPNGWINTKTHRPKQTVKDAGPPFLPTLYFPG
jgi:hypothetical protein